MRSSMYLVRFNMGLEVHSRLYCECVSRSAPWCLTVFLGLTRPSTRYAVLVRASFVQREVTSSHLALRQGAPFSVAIRCKGGVKHLAQSWKLCLVACDCSVKSKETQVSSLCRMVSPMVRRFERHVVCDPNRLAVRWRRSLFL